MFALALFLMVLTLLAKLKDWMLSWACCQALLMVQIKVVFEFPPSDSHNR